MTTASPSTSVECAITQAVATVTLNRAPQYNALSSEMLTALGATFDAIAKNSHVRAVVLAANGSAFCAGHDLKEMRAHVARTDHQRLFGQCSELMMKITQLPQPVIAKVQGMATAAGCQLVATCDLAIAANTATFAVSGIRVGLFCATPAVALSRNMTRKRAMEMLLTGEFIDANTALQYGLVNDVVAPTELAARVDQCVQNIIRHPKRVVTLGKQLFYRQLNQTLTAAYADATETIADNMMLPETTEGIDAFIAKRPPRWDLS